MMLRGHMVYVCRNKLTMLILSTATPKLIMEHKDASMWQVQACVRLRLAPTNQGVVANDKERNNQDDLFILA